MISCLLVYVHQTDDAILVYEKNSNNTEHSFWLTKSQIEYDETEISCANAGDELEINIPDWLAEQVNLL